MLKLIKILAVSLCLFASDLAPVSAQNTQASEVLTLVGQGKYDEARTLLRSFKPSRLDVLFLEAQISRAKGNLPKAVATLREILAAQPGLLLARRVLARVLIDQRDFEAAAFHLRTLERSDPNPSARRSYRDALSRISRAKPYGLSASFSLVPSSNINRGSYNEEYENSEGQTAQITSREESGLGGQFGLSGYVTTRVSEKGSLTFSANGLYTRYSQGEFDRSQVAGNLRYAHALEGQSWEVAASARRVFETSQYTRTIYGLDLTHRRVLNPRTRATVTLSRQRVNYDSVDNLSGPNYSTAFTLERQLSSTMSVLGGVSLGRSLPQGDNFQHVSVGVRGGITKTWTGGFATYFEARAGLRDYDARFTNSDPTRDDRYFALSANVLNSRLSVQGFAPRLGCSVIFNRSNIAFFDYNVQECRVSLTRGF